MKRSMNLRTWRLVGLFGLSLFVAILALPGIPTGAQSLPAGPQVSGGIGTDPPPGEDEQTGDENSEGIRLNVEPADMLTLTELQELSQLDPGDLAADGGIEEPNPFRPTMDEWEYQGAKAQANAEAGAFGPLGPTRESSTLDLNSVDQLGPAIPTGPTCNGAFRTDTLRPPDTHGAAGLSQYVEIVNTRLQIFNRFTCATQANVSLNSFFATVPGQPGILFDPRVIYDHIWNRWVMTAEGRPLNATQQFHYINVSTSSNALGSYFRFRVEVNFFNTSTFFWDYPQLGMDQDAIIITANIFNPGFVGAAMFAVAKARLYNGLGFGVPIHFPLPGTLAPPFVLDQNNNAFLVAAITNGGPFGRIAVLQLQNASNAFQQVLSGRPDVIVASYSVPPDARQPGTPLRLDTLDRRFVNASTQIGDRLYQVHTINSFGLPTPRWYEIRTTNSTLVNFGEFFEGPSSNDFNASIAANESRDLFVTWTSTDPNFPFAHQARMRVSGKRSFDAFIASPGFPMGPTSPTFYTGFRWGDYSAVTIDPLDRRFAWAVNELVRSTSTWKSTFGRMRRDPLSP